MWNQGDFIHALCGKNLTQTLSRHQIGMTKVPWPSFGTSKIKHHIPLAFSMAEPNLQTFGLLGSGLIKSII